MKPKTGRLTIVTDNLWYGRFLLQTLNQMIRGRRKHHLFIPAELTTTEEHEEKDRAGRFVLWSGAPGPWCGHPVAASSYFDRIWKRESKIERYVLAVVKA
uniref:Uncharacterized protein n=1 Tax=Lotharella oceanica TaxID=641309 RepID=A0A7S2TWL8_9EUKA